MRGLRVWMGASCLMAACGGGGSGADRPDGRPDSGGPSDAGTLPDGGSFLGPIGPLGETSWTQLLDPSLSNFYRYLPSQAFNADTRGVFQMDGGILHVNGLGETDVEQDFGYLATWADLGD